MDRNTAPAARQRCAEVEIMEMPGDVAAMLRLHAAGWGQRRIAEELGCSHETVRRYLRQGGWAPYGGAGRRCALDGLEDWLKARFLQHRGNADVVRQELEREKGVRVSLRTVERHVMPWRRELQAEALATVRFETPPGQQLQADFGEVVVEVGGERTKVHLCVLTLGFSRRCVVRAYRDERQGNWLETMEEAFREFGGVPAEVLVDNARALVQEHDVETGDVLFNERFRAFAAYWGFKPRACRPYRARTKGKDERGVGYVKRNAMAGRTFACWEELEAHLAWWTREVADVRVHGTTGELPRTRFVEAEAAALQPLPDKPPFVAEREVLRVVHNDACVEVESNWYSVPWRLLRCRVTVRVRDERVVILHGGEIVAQHHRLRGRRERQVDASHWQGLVPQRPTASDAAPSPSAEPLDSALGRSLQVYEAVVAGTEVAA
jgi:transposase